MTHQYHTDQLRDTATLYALGSLSAEEMQAFAEHLSTGCPLCAAEVQDVERLVGLLGYNAPAVQPPPAVRTRLLANLALEAAPAADTGQSRPDMTADFVYIRASEGRWSEFSPGVMVKVLYTDPTTKRSTALVRMAPGTRLPRHQHLAVEELFVLQGDCHIAPGQVLQAGDYFRAEANSVHGMTFTEAGTTFLTLCWNEFVTS